jgi:pimeloyl-ACP methyl ester carboxylesterase
MSDAIEQYIAASRAALTSAGLQRVEYDGRIFWRGGAGDDTLVLLHGVNDQAGTWSSVVPALMVRHELLVLDLAGHGDSEPREGPLTMERILADVHAVIDSDAKDKVTIVGNSMGGWVSMLYALEHPERVERLVLENASGMSWTVTVPLFAQNREQAAAIFHAVHGPDAFVPEEALDAIINRAASSPMTRVVQGGIAAHLLDSRFGNLDVPVSMIWGENDGLLPLEYAQALRARIPGATLSVIKGAAHIPHRQQPERFLECLTSTF